MEKITGAAALAEKLGLANLKTAFEMLLEPVKLFVFIGAAIRVHVSWLPFAALLPWLLSQHVFPALVPELRQASYRGMAFAGLIGFFLSILLRELARVVAARIVQIPLERVTLHVFGGVAELPEAGKKAVLTMLGSGFLASALLGILIAWILIEFVTTRTPLQVIGVGFFLALLNWALALVNIVLGGLAAAWRYWST